MENQITKALQNANVTEETQLSLQEAFTPFFEKAKEWTKKANEINVTDESQTELMLEARTGRLALKNIRTAVENKRKELKADALAKGKAIDGMANIIKYLIQPIETKLHEQENFVQIQEQKRREQLSEDRAKELEAYDVDTQFYKLADMPQETYDDLLANSKHAFELKKDNEKRLAEKKIEDEKKQRVYSQRRQTVLGKTFANYFDYNELTVDTTDAEYKVLLKNAVAKKKTADAKARKVKAENLRLKKEADARKKEDEKKDARKKVLFDMGLHFDGQSFIYEDINFHWTDVLTYDDDKFNKTVAAATERMKVIKADEAAAKEIEDKRIADEKKIQTAEPIKGLEADHVVIDEAETLEAETIEHVNERTAAVRKELMDAPTEKALLNEMVKGLLEYPMPPTESEAATAIVKQTKDLLAKTVQFMKPKINELK